MGTLVNTGAVIVGGVLGLLLKKGMSERYQDILMQANGLAVIFIGISGAMSRMLVLSEEGLLTISPMMLVVSLSVGSLIGEFLQFEERLNQWGEKLKQNFSNSEDEYFVNGFVTTTLTICVGAMAIVGSLQDGLLHDPSMLYTKAILDFVIVMVYAAALGIGCLFSALPLALLQGSITLFASMLSFIFTDVTVNRISFVGSVLIFCVGCNLMFKTKIKVADLIFALPVMLLLSYFFAT